MAHKIVVEFYPISIDYQMVEDGTKVRLFGITKENEKVVVEDVTFNPYFLVEADGDLEKVSEKIMDTKVEASSKKGKEEEIESIETEIVTKKVEDEKTDLIKVKVKHPRDINHLKGKIKKLKKVAKVREDDISFYRRYLIDKGITPLTQTRVEGTELEESYDIKYGVSADKIKNVSSDTLEGEKILFYDIETYNPQGTSQPEEHPVIAISFYSGRKNNFKKKVITWKYFKDAPSWVEFVDSEMDLIKRFIKFVREESPDFIVGYGTDNFDFPYLKERAENFDISLDIGINGESINFVRRGRGTVSKIGGISHIDLSHFIKKIISPTLDTDTYDLHSVGKEIAGEGKKERDISEMYKWWDKGGKGVKRICKYCLQDSYITKEVFYKNRLPMFELTKLVGLPIFDTSRMSYGSCVEWFLCRKAFERNRVIRNKPVHEDVTHRSARTYTGGFVRKPSPGIYENIGILDFKSLYPTIIVAHNIDPNTLNCNCCKKSEIPNMDIHFCKEKKGFIPSVIKNLIERRSTIKDILKKTDEEDPEHKVLSARSYALKTVSNAMYGSLGYPRSRWYSLECAKSITALGRKYMKDTIEVAEEEGYDVIYGDTDSVLISMGEEKIEEFLNKINEELPKEMKLEKEGYFPRGIFVSKKSDIEEGAKKKYALIRKDGKLVIKGFEAMRRDWAEIAKETQKKVLRTILSEKGEDPEEKAFQIVRDTIRKLKDHKIPIRKLKIKKKIKKPIEEYKSIGPHIAAVKKAKKRGREVRQNMVAEYVICKGEGSISDRSYLAEEAKRMDRKYDPEYYIDRQIFPTVEKIFDVLGYSKDELKGKIQTKLRKFFGGEENEEG